MRKCKLFVFSALLFAGSAIKAQQAETLPPAADKKNILKMNLSSLVFKNFSFQYERVIAPKMSVGLGISVMPKTGLPFASTLKDQYGNNSDAARAIDETRLSNFAITPEIRFYLGKKMAPTGFYVAPYMRYNKLNFDQVYTFTPSDNKLHTANITGDFTNIGGGLMFGAQWNLSKSLTLDWWIAGAAVGSAKATLSGTDPQGIPAQDRADIERDLEDFDFPGYTVESTVGANQINVNMKGTYYGVRAFGLALGIKF